jgi:hypothetical protein
VDGSGKVIDQKKFSLFQANVILWLGGLHSQIPDKKNIEMIESAADYLVENLYKGDGHWFEYFDPETEEKMEFFWNPRSENYIAFALFHAYKFSGKEIYRQIATETAKRQRADFPDGKIFAEFDEALEIGQRFPEHMGHYEDYKINKDQEALAFIHKYDQNYRGIYAIEKFLTPEGEVFDFRHGLAIIDKLLFGYVSKKEAAFAEGVALYQKYRNQGHQDDKAFRNEVPGEASDNGRDYYDKRISMATIIWSKLKEEKFREEIIQMWNESTHFWHNQAPYGFYINTAQDRKTCFSINQPAMLIDLTPPTILKVTNDQKALWNNQLKILVHDPNYKWLDYEFKGIGTDPQSINITISTGIQYGNIYATKAECEDCYEISVNIFTPNKAQISLEIADQLKNAQILEFEISSSIALSSWNKLNFRSFLYYATWLILINLSLNFIVQTQIKKADS